MPRFVVLTHDHPTLHWDFMLEHEGVLRTWRLAQPPDTQGAICAEALPDHRLAYLDYEGPVSGDRGTVERWDAGTYNTLEWASNRVVVDLAGKKLAGVAPLRRHSAKGCISNLPAQTLARIDRIWTFWRLPSEGPKRAIEIPRLLTRLIAEGRWPTTRTEVGEQSRQPLVSEERVRLLAPEESLIHLNAPPFLTVREDALQNSAWCEPWSDPSGIDFDLAVYIGDFAIGSDSAILLDYRESLDHPRVIRLRWSANGRDNKWVLMAGDFATFVNVLGL
jgi:hypothetical protein